MSKYHIMILFNVCWKVWKDNEHVDSWAMSKSVFWEIPATFIFDHHNLIWRNSLKVSLRHFMEHWTFMEMKRTKKYSLKPPVTDFTSAEV